MANMVNVFNAVRATLSPTFKERVPQATADNIASVANPLLTYSATTNEFLSALVNRIGLTLVRNKTLKNPLEILKQGTMPLGKDIEEIYTNPAKAETYNPKSTDLLKQKVPDTKAIFHRLNRQDKYTVTINNPQLRQAFISWENLESLINSITNTLYSGNYLDEFILCKNLFASAIDNNKIIQQTITPITSADTAKAFITTARLLHTNFNFPSSNYNSYSQSGGTGDPVITWTPPEDIRFILRSDIEAYTDVNVLASAFNMSKTDFLGQTLIVDDFGTTDSHKSEKCVAIMCDKAFTQIYDNFREMTEFYNADNLTYNYYYHVWQTYSISTLCNAVAFMESEI